MSRSAGRPVLTTLMRGMPGLDTLAACSMKAWSRMKKPPPLEACGLAGLDSACSHVAATLLFMLALWSQASYATPALSQASHPVPLLRSATQQAAGEASCSGHRGVLVSDEDRLLAAGGKRIFTGRSQRKGDTYVAEATSHRDGSCADATVQLYLFHDGKFVGAATPYSLALKQARFESFALVDPEHLRYVVADSTSADTRCARTRGRHPQATTTLVLDAHGGTLRMDPRATWSYQARQLRYPLDANGHLNEGKVVVHVTVDKDGFPADIRITQESSHPELNQAAIESVRRSCFNPAEPGVDVPVNFSVRTL